MAKKLPKKIYGFWYLADSPEDIWLKTSDDPNEMVDQNESVEVGVYELVGRATITNTTTEPVTKVDVRTKK